MSSCLSHLHKYIGVLELPSPAFLNLIGWNQLGFRTFCDPPSTCNLFDFKFTLQIFLQNTLKMVAPMVTWQLSQKVVNRLIVWKPRNLIQNFLILQGKFCTKFSHFNSHKSFQICWTATNFVEWHNIAKWFVAFLIVSDARGNCWVSPCFQHAIIWFHSEIKDCVHLKHRVTLVLNSNDGCTLSEYQWPSSTVKSPGFFKHGSCFSFF
jgi:hypothetical protein